MEKKGSTDRTTRNASAGWRSALAIVPEENGRVVQRMFVAQDAQRCGTEEGALRPPRSVGPIQRAARTREIWPWPKTRMRPASDCRRATTQSARPPTSAIDSAPRLPSRKRYQPGRSRRISEVSLGVVGRKTQSMDAGNTSGRAPSPRGSRLWTMPFDRPARVGDSPRNRGRIVTKNRRGRGSEVLDRAGLLYDGPPAIAGLPFVIVFRHIRWIYGSRQSGISCRLP